MSRGDSLRASSAGYPAVDLNCDLGESYGVWRLGSDEEMMALITSANIACGFHAGDPGTMRRTVRLAQAHGVIIGAHPGYADLPGFGRRPMALSVRDTVDLLVYQIGALQAIARAEGAEVSYVKAHGALYNQAEADPEAASAIVEAVRQSSDRRPLALVGSPFSAMERAASAGGVRFVGEVFADRAYTSDGRLVARDRPGAVITDPAFVAQRVTEMVRRGELTSEDGRVTCVSFETICLHGDTPGAVALARSVRAALERGEVRVAPFA